MCGAICRSRERHMLITERCLWSPVATESFHEIEWKGWFGSYTFLSKIDLCLKAVLSVPMDLVLSAMISRRVMYVSPILSLEIFCICFELVASSQPSDFILLFTFASSCLTACLTFLLKEYPSFISKSAEVERCDYGGFIHQCCLQCQTNWEHNLSFLLMISSKILLLE